MKHIILGTISEQCGASAPIASPEPRRNRTNSRVSYFYMKHLSTPFYAPIVVKPTAMASNKKADDGTER